MRSPLLDGVRLAVGTLTVYPVRPPRTVDRRVASWAMTSVPLIALLLAVPVSVLLWVLGWPVLGIDPVADSGLGGGPVLSAAMAVGLLALLTRAIHLDGLADTADGLGSGRPAEQALAVMRKSDIGPFGVITLMLVLLVQVAALAELLAIGRGPLALVTALVLSRLVLPLVCSRWVPAARREGLGHSVAGSVSGLQVGLAVVVSAVVAGGLAAWQTGASSVLDAFVVAVVALGCGMLICLRCVRRLGGVTGDVMGACAEVTFTIALVVPIWV